MSIRVPISMILLKKINKNVRDYVSTLNERTLSGVLIVLAVISFIALMDIIDKTKVYNLFWLALPGIAILIWYGLSLNFKWFKKHYLDLILRISMVLVMSSLFSEKSNTNLKSIGIRLAIVLILIYFYQILGFLTQFFPFSLLFQNQLFHARHKILSNTLKLSEAIIHRVVPELKVERIDSDENHMYLFFKMKQGYSLTEEKSRELTDKLSEEFGYATITNTKKEKRILMPKATSTD